MATLMTDGGSDAGATTSGAGGGSGETGQEAAVDESVAAGGSEGSSGGTPGESTGAGVSVSENPLTGDSSETPADWKASLPDELKDDPALGPIVDIAGLAKSYVNAQKMVGADKIQVPSKYAEKHEWTGVFRKLGLPENLEQYEVKAPDGAEVDEGFLSEFKEAAFGEGVLPGQAQALFDWYQSKAVSLEEEMAAKAEAQIKEQLDGLQAEWGDKFKIKVAAGKMALKQFDPEGQFSEYLEKSGLGNDAEVIKFMAKVGESLNEDKFRHDAVSNVGLDAKQAEEKINNVMGDTKHPYHDKNHPDHKRAVDEMNRMFQTAYPS